MLRPEVGDTVVIKGTITHIMERHVIISTGPADVMGLYCNTSRISEIIRAPKVPKVGDTVWWGPTTSGNGYKLIYRYEDYGIVVQSDQPPVTVWFSKLRCTPECVD